MQTQDAAHASQVQSTNLAITPGSAPAALLGVREISDYFFSADPAQVPPMPAYPLESPQYPLPGFNPLEYPAISQESFIAQPATSQNIQSQMMEIDLDASYLAYSSGQPRPPMPYSPQTAVVPGRHHPYAHPSHPARSVAHAHVPIYYPPQATSTDVQPVEAKIQPRDIISMPGSLIMQDTPMDDLQQAPGPPPPVQTPGTHPGHPQTQTGHQSTHSGVWDQRRENAIDPSRSNSFPYLDPANSVAVPQPSRQITEDYILSSITAMELGLAQFKTTVLNHDLEGEAKAVTALESSWDALCRHVNARSGVRATDPKPNHTLSRSEPSLPSQKPPLSVQPTQLSSLQNKSQASPIHLQMTQMQPQNTRDANAEASFHAAAQAHQKQLQLGEGHLRAAQAKAQAQNKAMLESNIQQQPTGHARHYSTASYFAGPSPTVPPPMTMASSGPVISSSIYPGPITFDPPGLAPIPITSIDPMEITQPPDVSTLQLNHNGSIYGTTPRPKLPNTQSTTSTSSAQGSRDSCSPPLQYVPMYSNVPAAPMPSAAGPVRPARSRAASGSGYASGGTSRSRAASGSGFQSLMETRSRAASSASSIFGNFERENDDTEELEELEGDFDQDLDIDMNLDLEDNDVASKPAQLGGVTHTPDSLLKNTLDPIFMDFLADLCSDLEATDSKGELIHQTLMAKKMERLDQSQDFRPFKFRIQAFTSAFQETLAARGHGENEVPFKKVRQYLWSQPCISRFNDDGKKAKSKGNHIWSIEAKKVPDKRWIFKEFTRCIKGTPPPTAHCGTVWTWAPRVWDPQCSSQSLNAVFSSPSLPAWLTWKDNVLMGKPPVNCAGDQYTITARASFYVNSQAQHLDTTFTLTVAAPTSEFEQMKQDAVASRYPSRAEPVMGYSNSVDYVGTNYPPSRQSQGGEMLSYPPPADLVTDALMRATQPTTLMDHQAMSSMSEPNVNLLAQSMSQFPQI